MSLVVGDGRYRYHWRSPRPGAHQRTGRPTLVRHLGDPCDRPPIARATTLSVRRHLPQWRIAVTLTSFVDRTVVPYDGVTFLAGVRRALPRRFTPRPGPGRGGLCHRGGVFVVVVVHNDPRSGVGNFVVASIIFAIVWTIAFGVGRKSEEADEAEERANRAEREREDQCARGRCGGTGANRARASRRRWSQRQRDDRPGLRGAAAPAARSGS